MLQVLPAFVRVPLFVAISLTVLSPGATLPWAGLAHLLTARIVGRCISGRTISGRRRKPSWRSIGTVARLPRENQIVVSQFRRGGQSELR